MMPAQEALGQDFAAVPVLVLFRRHAEGAGKSEATVASIVAIVHTFLDTDDLQPSYHHRGDTSVYTEYGHAQIRSWDGIYPSAMSTMEPAANMDDLLFDGLHTVAWDDAMIRNERPRVGPGIPTARDDWVHWMRRR